MVKINVNCNNSIQLKGEKVVYIDPFRIKDELHDADYVFCTHSHYDHFSPEDIQKVINNKTKIITVEEAREDALKLVDEERLLIVKAEGEYKIDEIKFCTTYAYNVDKAFHPKENKWVGYILELEDVKYYIAGDTDNIPEIQDVCADVAFLPVGGTYTMNYKEASKLANNINVQTVIPTHYGSVAGKKEDGECFKKLVINKDVKLFDI